MLPNLSIKISKILDFGFLCKNVMSSFINKLKNIVISMLENQNLVSFLSSEARCSPHGFNKKELQIFIKFRTNQVVFKSFYIFSTNFGIHFRIRRTMLSGNQRAEWIFFRVHIFWEGHKFFRNLHQLCIWLAVHSTNNWWWFRKNVWPY